MSCLRTQRLIHALAHFCPGSTAVTINFSVAIVSPNLKCAYWYMGNWISFTLHVLYVLYAWFGQASLIDLLQIGVWYGAQMSIQCILMPESHTEVRCPGTWGLELTTPNPRSKSTPKPALPATQPRAPNCQNQPQPMHPSYRARSSVEIRKIKRPHVKAHA